MNGPYGDQIHNLGIVSTKLSPSELISVLMMFYKAKDGMFQITVTSSGGEGHRLKLLWSKTCKGKLSPSCKTTKVSEDTCLICISLSWLEKLLKLEFCCSFCCFFQMLHGCICAQTTLHFYLTALKSAVLPIQTFIISTHPYWYQQSCGSASLSTGLEKLYCR